MNGKRKIEKVEDVSWTPALTHPCPSYLLLQVGAELNSSLASRVQNFYARISNFAFSRRVELELIYTLRARLRGAKL